MNEEGVKVKVGQIVSCGRAPLRIFVDSNGEHAGCDRTEMAALFGGVVQGVECTKGEDPELFVELWEVVSRERYSMRLAIEIQKAGSALLP